MSSTGARVESIDALVAFKLAVIKFVEAASSALGDVESDIQRTIVWLENEQESHWSGQIRSRAEVLARAQDALRQKTAFKDATGRIPSAIEEQKMVAQAQKRLQEAQGKLAKVRQHAKRLQKESLLYKGQVQRLQTTVSSDLPAAVAHLGALIATLEEYAALGPAGGGALSTTAAEFFGGGMPGSMARGDGTSPEKPPPARLRGGGPSSAAREALAVSAQGPSGPLTAPIVSDTERTIFGGLPVSWTAAGAGDKVVIAKAAYNTTRVFLERIAGAAAGDSGWYVGTADPPDAASTDAASIDATPLEAVKVSDLIAARPDWSPVLALPPGSVVLLDRGGISAVLNERDEDVWAAATASAPASAQPTA